MCIPGLGHVFCHTYVVMHDAFANAHSDIGTNSVQKYQLILQDLCKTVHTCTATHARAFCLQAWVLKDSSLTPSNERHVQEPASAGFRSFQKADLMHRDLYWNCCCHKAAAQLIINTRTNLLSCTTSSIRTHGQAHPRNGAYPLSLTLCTAVYLPSCLKVWTLSLINSHECSAARSPLHQTERGRPSVLLCTYAAMQPGM